MLEFLRVARFALKNVRLNLSQLSDQVMAVHTLITVLAVIWGLMISQVWLVVVTAVLWLLAVVMWVEYKHSEW